MTKKEIFQLWAPNHIRWTEWVRPVLFVAMNDREQIKPFHNFTIPKINYMDSKKANIAIILDLPGYDSIMEGLALARKGYRPIPLYNGTMAQAGSMATVDNLGIQSALQWATSKLQEIELDSEAPPVFLLDSNRLLRLKMNGTVFDNSWDVYHQDMPSGEYFLKHGIDTIIVRGEKIARDLALILYKFQKKGITIQFTKGYEVAKSIKIRKPLQKES